MKKIICTFFLIIISFSAKAQILPGTECYKVLDGLIEMTENDSIAVSRFKELYDVYGISKSDDIMKSDASTIIKFFNSQSGKKYYCSFKGWQNRIVLLEQR